MSKLNLSVAIGDYDRNRPLLDGAVQIDGVDPVFMALDPEEIFFRAFRHAEFDICELSMSSSTVKTAQGGFAYVGVPVFVSRAFRHTSIYVRTDRIKKPADLKGKTIGVWFFGNEYPFLSWMSKLGFKTDGSPGGVKMIKQGFNVDPLLQKQADCVSTMTYNEYWQVIDGGYKPSQLVVFKYEDEGVATLEDGLYVLEKNLKDPAFVTKMAKFVKASMKGWDYAKKNPDEAVKIILAGDSTGAKTEKDQKRMMTEIGKLLGAADGKLDVKDYDRTVATLMSGGSDPVITKKPEGAYTFAVYDAMK